MLGHSFAYHSFQYFFGNLAYKIFSGNISTQVIIVEVQIVDFFQIIITTSGFKSLGGIRVHFHMCNRIEAGLEEAFRKATCTGKQIYKVVSVSFNLIVLNILCKHIIHRPIENLYCV